MKQTLRYAILAAAMIAAVSLLAQQPATKPDPFGPLRFMVGSWSGVQSGEPGTGKSERTYEFVLDGRFLQVSNQSTYPPQEKNKAGEVHHDMGMIGYDRARKKLVFRQFHTEGFVNTYVQQETGDPTKLVFETESIENIPAGFRARETYTIVGNDEFVERFEVADPGRDFALYSEARLKRVK
jgi:hypothetical protein